MIIYRYHSQKCTKRFWNYPKSAQKSKYIILKTPQNACGYPKGGQKPIDIILKSAQISHLKSAGKTIKLS